MAKTGRQRRYSVAELDALRQVAEMRYLYGTTVWDEGMSRCYMEQDRIRAVEELTRTYMLAGFAAQDIVDSDNAKRGK